MAKQKRKGSETAPKARTPSQAPDPGGVTKGILGEQVARLAKYEKDKDESVKSLRDQRKLMKGQGIDLEIMDKARWFQKFDEATRMLKLQTLARYLQWLNLLSSGEEADLFNTAAPALSNDEGDVADHKGRMAARQFAKPEDNPYSPGSDNYETWEKARLSEIDDMKLELGGGAKSGNKQSKGRSADAGAEAAPVH